MTPFEIVVAGRMIEQGYEMYNNGWPDFCFVKRDGDCLTVRFMEVKTANDEVRANQKQMHDIFKSLGMVVEVVHEDPQQKMVPCFGAPPPRSVGRPANQLEKAKIWLAARMCDDQPKLSAALIREAKDAEGISADTLRKAKDELHVRVFKTGAGRATQWWWKLETPPEAPAVIEPENVDELIDFGGSR